MSADSSYNGKISFGEKVGYSLGDLAANLVFQMIMIYQLKFYTDVFGLNGAIAGSVLLVAPMVSAVCQPHGYEPEQWA